MLDSALDLFHLYVKVSSLNLQYVRLKMSHMRSYIILFPMYTKKAGNKLLLKSRLCYT